MVSLWSRLFSKQFNRSLLSDVRRKRLFYNFCREPLSASYQVLRSRNISRHKIIRRGSTTSTTRTEVLCETVDDDLEDDNEEELQTLLTVLEKEDAGFIDLDSLVDSAASKRESF